MIIALRFIFFQTVKGSAFNEYEFDFSLIIMISQSVSSKDFSSVILGMKRFSTV